MDSGREGEIRFQSCASATRTHTAWMVFMFVAGCGMLAIGFSAEDPEWVLRTLLSLLSAIFFLIGILLYRQRANGKKVWAVGAEGLRELSGTGQGIRWADVADIEIEATISSDNTIRLIDHNGRKAVVIGCDDFPDGGRGLVDALRMKLGRIFEREARRYLDGEKKWRVGAVNEALRIEGGNVYVRNPKKNVIPLGDIRKVEWLPRAISGARQGGWVLIYGPDWRLELPQNIEGMQFFLYCLKYMCGLGGRVNPVLPAGLRDRIDETRKKQGALSKWHTIGGVLILTPVLVFIVNKHELADAEAIKKSGTPAMATIVEVRENSVVLVYQDRNGADQIVTAQAHRSFTGTHRPGAIIPIRIHPTKQRMIGFRGKSEWTRKSFASFIAIGVAGVCIGAGVLVRARMRGRQYETELAGLELASMAGAGEDPAIESPID